jgi:hypothetical protein
VFLAVISVICTAYFSIGHVLGLYDKVPVSDGFDQELTIKLWP